MYVVDRHSDLGVFLVAQDVREQDRMLVEQPILVRALLHHSIGPIGQLVELELLDVVREAAGRARRHPPLCGGVLMQDRQMGRVD